MDAGGNGLSMRGLAQKLEALTERLAGLERENERVRTENTGLRQKVAALTESARDGAAALSQKPAPDGPLSRRALLGKAGAAAMAAAAGGVLLSPREAKAATVEGRGAPGVSGIATANESMGVLGDVALGVTGAHGVWGQGTGADYAGVYGYNGSGHGVRGETARSGGYAGVYGDNKSGSGGPGVVGNGRDDWPGVWGRNTQGTGVKGEGKNGVIGQTSADNFAAVYGQHAGTSGVGVMGDGKGAVYPGVLGRNGGGAGVRGEGATGVFGRSASGYGGLFQGAKAQLRLIPGPRAGRPTTGRHEKGELYMDSAATLWVCAAAGTPGTWRRVTTTAVS